MSRVDTDSLLLVGVCGPPHGVKGEIKVVPETDDPARLLDMARLFVGTSASDAVERQVTSSRLQTNRRGVVVLVQLDGVSSREAAEALRKLRVYCPEEDLPPLDEGEFFLHDLVGMSVVAIVDDQKSEIGHVASVIEGIAQDLLVVARDGRPDVLVPDVEPIVENVDPEARVITIRPPEGLLD